MILKCLTILICVLVLASCNEKKDDSTTHQNKAESDQDIEIKNKDSLIFTQIDPKFLPPDISYRGMHVINPNLVWLAGSKGTIMKTLDGGKSWYNYKIQSETETELRDIVAFDENTSITTNIGSPARILKTIDGGQNWTVVYENQDSLAFLDAIEFWNDSIGLVFGDPIDDQLFILKTTDGGETWTRIQNDHDPLAGFAASGTSIALQTDGLAWIATGGDKSSIYHSKDWGETWVEQISNLPKGSSEKGIYSIAFKDDLHGIAVGTNYLESECDSTCAVTKDGGKSWQVLAESDPSGYRSCVAFCNEECAKLKPFCLTCGTTGCDISFNNGVNWQTINSLNLNVVEFAPNATLGWAANSKGAIYKITLE